LDVSRARGFAIVGFAAALLLGYFAWEWFLSPVARVKGTLEGAASAAEGLDFDRLLSYLADDYSDVLDADRASLESRLKEAFSRVDRLNVTLRDIDVDVAKGGGEASARFDLVVVAIRGDERTVVIGTPFEGERVEGDFTRTSAGWKIRRVDRSRPAR
jgi:hypothetical protein